MTRKQLVRMTKTQIRSTLDLQQNRTLEELDLNGALKWKIDVPLEDGKTQAIMIFETYTYKVIVTKKNYGEGEYSNKNYHYELISRYIGQYEPIKNM